MSIPCPLCHSTNTSCQEAISVTELNALYERKFGVVGALKSPSLEYRICLNCALGFFNPMETGGEDMYEQLQTFDWYYMADKEEYRIAQQLIPSEGLVLEVGSGKAAFAVFFGANRYTGLEFNEQAIEKAALSGIALLKEAVEDHARKCPQKYDVVVSFQVLEHVGAPATFISGCVDCLKPGGILILSVPSRDGFLGRAINSILDMPPHHVTHWSVNTLKKLGPQFGLKCCTVVYEPVADYHLNWARKVILEARLRGWLGMDEVLLDSRMSANIISKFSSLLAYFWKFNLAGLKGHSMIACYVKE